MAILAAVAIALFLGVGPLTGTALATPTPQTPPMITTNAWVGQTLTLTPGTYAAPAPTVSDAWYRCTNPLGIDASCVAVGDTTTTYTVGNGDVGFYMKVKETATDTLPSTLTTDSNVTFQVTAAAPTLQTAPTIRDATSGTSTVSPGDTLSVTGATWTRPPDRSSFQWLDCDSLGTTCAAIAGATSASYVTRPSDAGHTIQLLQTPHYGPTALTPAAALIGAPANSPPSPPTITGTALQGATLTASPGSWSPSATGYDYQWQDCDSGGHACAAIQGATGPTYTLTAADVGGTVVVSVKGVNAAGTGTAGTSARTAVVQTASTLSLVAAPGGSVTNQLVTLAATVTSRAAAGAPSGSVTFLDRGRAISGCAGVPVAPSGQSATVLCQTSFAAGSPQLTASFTPAAGSVVLGSSSPSKTLTVGRDIPTTALDASAQVQIGSATTYTATVAQAASRSGPIQPTGEVEFLDGGKPIAGCAAQRLDNGGATCRVRYSATGSRSIVARYLGDINFAGSSSPVRAVRVTALSLMGGITATMQWTFSYAATYTRVISMVINGLPTGATVQILCHGRGCPFAKRSRAITKPKPCTGKAKRAHSCPVHGKITLTGTFRRRNLRPGTQITIEIRRPRFVGKYYSFTMRPRKEPRVRIACLAAGNRTRPNVGC